MDDDVKRWLEEQYQEFESQFLSHLKFWRAPAETLRGTPLYDLFEVFTSTFPDHPSDINTVFYLIESVSVTPVHHSVWLWCSHFEHSTLGDLRDLVLYMDGAMRVLSTSEESGFVEILDGIGERIVLAFSFPPDNIVELIQARGVRGGVGAV
jgi:hypothetical protein